MGTAITCSGTMMSEHLKASTRLLHHQQHRIIEDLYHESDEDELLHGAQLDPLLRALSQTTGRAPVHWLLLSSVSVERCAQPLPCPSSVPVALCFSRHLVDAVVGGADRAVATLCCSCLHHERRRRCRRHQASPCSPFTVMSATGLDQLVTKKKQHKLV